MAQSYKSIWIIAKLEQNKNKQQVSFNFKEWMMGGL